MDVSFLRGGFHRSSPIVQARIFRQSYRFHPANQFMGRPQECAETARQKWHEKMALQTDVLYKKWSQPKITKCVAKLMISLFSYRYSKCFGFYHGKSPWNHHVFYFFPTTLSQSELKWRWLQVCDDVFFCGLVFETQTKSGKGVEAFSISTESYPIGLFVVMITVFLFTINPNVNKHVWSIKQKFMVKWWRHVLLHVFATRKTQPKSLEVPRIDGGCICHELSREEYFLGRVIEANSTVLSLCF